MSVTLSCKSCGKRTPHRPEPGKPIQLDLWGQPVEQIKFRVRCSKCGTVYK